MSDDKPNVAVFLSGGGSNLQALIDATKAGILSANIALVLSNKSKAFGLERARNEEIPAVFLGKTKSDGPKLMELLNKHEIKYIALAGYLKLLPVEVIREFAGRIINIHPALLPKFGGKGMYGHHVHEAVLAAGEKESGPTVHLADEIYDNGRILEQMKVPVLDDDTPDTLAARVLEKEHSLFPRVLQKLIKGEYSVD